MTYEAALVLRLADLARFSYELNANTITFGLAMNAQRYASLAPAQQVTIDEVLGASAGMQLARALTNAADEGRHYMHGAGVLVVTPGKDDQIALAGIAESVSATFVTELTRQNLPARTVLDALKTSVDH
jgi:TRAP-type C4-dicarboxylate transport system substrate-binding protein